MNPVGSKLDTSVSVGNDYGVSKGSVVSLIRINKLIDELKALVDSGELSIRAGGELSFLSEDYRKALNLCGSKSGRDCDKDKEAGLTPYYTDGTTAYEEADLIFVCRKLYAQEMKPECFTVDGPDEKWYPGKDYHTMYMGEIVKVLKRV